ncbi:nitroreductase family protein [Chloroflexota bacterium]
MTLDNLTTMIKSRHSIRKWQDKEVPEELLLKAVELATLAPNGGNQQNWYFYVIRNRDIIKTIADIVQKSTAKLVSWPEAGQFKEVTPNMVERSGFFQHAPAAIAIAARDYQSVVDKVLAVRENADPEAGKMRQWRNIANARIQSVAAAIAYLLLVLNEMGLGGVWMTGPMQVKEEIEKILKVPSDMDVVAFIPIGYPAETPEPMGRRPLSEVCEVVK